MKRDFHRLVTEFSHQLCFFADRPRQERECKSKRPSSVYQAAIHAHIELWEMIKEERIAEWSRKYFELEEFANMIEELGKKVFFAGRSYRWSLILYDRDWLNIERKAVQLVVGHNLHEELA